VPPCTEALDETLDDLHHLLRHAFEWDDDHLYSFWLNGEFWSDEASEYTSPVEAEPDEKTADVALDEVDLREGQEIVPAQVGEAMQKRTDWGSLLTPGAIERASQQPPKAYLPAPSW